MEDGPFTARLRRFLSSQDGILDSPVPSIPLSALAKQPDERVEVQQLAKASSTATHREIF